MRIVVSGTHASGKSTLLADLAARHPEYRILPDPFEEMRDDAVSELDADLFERQLRISAKRLTALPNDGEDGVVLAERGPIDFLAYLLALDRLRRPGRSAGDLGAAIEWTRAAAAHIDVLVVLPIDDGIRVDDEEDPELRDEADQMLRELAEDGDLSGARTIEVSGTPEARLAQLEEVIRGGG